MIKIYTQSTHSKIDYDDTKEAQDIKKLLLKSFIAKDTSLENDPRVKRGYMSPYENFYNEENDILPTGLIPYVFEILKEKNVEYEHKELRSFPSVNKQIIKDLMDDKVEFVGKDGSIRKPRDYQKESILKLIKNKGGIVNLSTGSGKTLISAILPLIYRKYKVLFVFDSIDLIHQTYNDFVDDYGIDPEEISIIQGSNYKYDAKKSRIILLSMQSYEKAFHIFPQVKVLLSDECFPPKTTVKTKNGQKTISELVLSKSTEEVLSFNIKTNLFEYKPITNWYQKEIDINKDKFIHLKFNIPKDNLKMTPDHKIYILEDGKIFKKKARELKVGDSCIFNSYPKCSIGGVLLSKKQYQAVLGMILGDSYIGRSGKSARLCFSQGEKQKEYLEYKLKILDNMYFRKKFTQFKSGYNENNIIYGTSTQCSDDFFKLQNEVYIENVKSIKNIINKIDEISLAFWIMDDASLTHNRYQLSTHSFTKEENELIIKTFKEKFDIDSQLLYDKRCDKYYLSLKKDSSFKLSKMISSYVHPSMNYKLFDEHKNNFNFDIDDKINYAIKKIKEIEYVKPKRKYVYDLEVKDNHNYIVGSGLLVSNCHSTGRTATAQKIIYSCQNASIKIGLSATPDRISNPAEQLRLYSLMGPIIYEKKIIEQIDGKHISDLTVNIYEVKFPNDEMIEVVNSYADVYEKNQLTKLILATEMRLLFKFTVKKCNELIKKYFDKDERVDEVDIAIKSLIDNWKEKDERNEIVKEDEKYFFRRFKEYGNESTHYIYNDLRNDLFADIAKKNKRVLILFNKINHGIELHKRLPNALLIHGNDKEAIRKEAEEYLKKDENSIVISSKIWAKGKNIPEIENYINAGAGVSEIEQIQKMGRAIRLSAITNKTMAHVHDTFDNFSPLAIKQSRQRLRVYKKEGLKIIYHGA